MRVVFVNRYFYPDHSATSQMVSALAFHLASRGWDIGAITSRQLYDEPDAQLPRRETVNGVRILRVGSTNFGRASLVGRAFDYLSFAHNALWKIHSQRDALIVAMTDPPLTSVIAAAAHRPYINWLQDLFPDVAEALGVRAPRFLHRVRDWSLRRARANVVIGEQMASRVPRPVVRENWAVGVGHQTAGSRQQTAGGETRGSLDFARDDGGDARDDGGGSPLLSAAGCLLPTFTVGYSGNLGRAHDVATMIGAMRLLREDLAIAFKITGGGARLDEVRRENLPNVRFAPYASLEGLSDSLASVDVHLVSLNPRLEGLIVPSKFYGVLAVGRPVIYIGARDGELARLVLSHEIGYVVEPGEAVTLANAIRELANAPGKARTMGERALALYRERFSAEIAMEHWERILRDAM